MRADFQGAWKRSPNRSPPHRQDLDWEYLLGMAREHRIMLYCTGTLAKPLQELLRLMRIFGEHGVLASPYKGTGMVATAYGNFALREFIDLDVLFRRQDLPKATKLLASLGYCQEGPLLQSQEPASLSLVPTMGDWQSAPQPKSLHSTIWSGWTD